jgi:hypothetical protein
MVVVFVLSFDSFIYQEIQKLLPQRSQRTSAKVAEKTNRDFISALAVWQFLLTALA